MAEDNQENKSGLLKRLLKACLRSPVNFLFSCAVVYCALQAYVLAPSLINKMILLGVVGLWMIWFLAKHLIVLLVVLALLGGGAYVYYELTGREARKCEENGGFWNKNTQTCEEKVSLFDKVKKLFEFQTVK